MYRLHVATLFVGLLICAGVSANEAAVPAPPGNPLNASMPPCNAEAAIAKFELKVMQDGKPEADLVASPSSCGSGARVAIQHIPSVPFDARQVDASNALDVEWLVERVARPDGSFMVSLETKHLDSTHSIQAAPGLTTANLVRRSWSGVVSLKPGEEMTILKDGGQVATMRRVQ